MLNKDQFADNHFIRTIIEEDLKSGKHEAIQTRFPPEPNGKRCKACSLVEICQPELLRKRDRSVGYVAGLFDET